MSGRRLRLILLSSLVLFGLLGSVWTPVSASSNALSRTVLTLDDRGALDLGEDIILSGTLKDAYDRPIVGRPVRFTLGEEYLGQARSDEDGYFERKLKNALKAGIYEITATTNATHFLAASSISISMRILPAEVRVQTVPAIAGVGFELDGRRFVSGADGSAAIKVDEIGEHQLHVLAEEYEAPAQRLEFGRWLQESFSPTQTIRVPNKDVIQVGLNVFHLVKQSFVDPEGNPVDDGRITSFKIRSIQGDVFEFTDGQPRWIPASRTARRINGLEETKLLYSVINVMVNGSNVVNQSQQRFYTHAGDDWEISLLFYSMRVGAQDGLFGNPVGTSVNLEFPDGSVQNYPLNENGMAEIDSLPRGIYTIDFLGIKGKSNRTPVALSLDQEVHTKVITYVDMVVVGLLGVFLALGLLLYGRPWLVHGFLRKKPAVVEQEELAWISSPVRYEEAIFLTEENFQQLTGVSREAYTSMLALLKERWGERGKRTKLSREDQLLMTLIYSQGEHSREQLGEVYSVSISTVRRTIKKVKAILDGPSPDELEPINQETDHLDRHGWSIVNKVELDSMVEVFDQDVEAFYEK